MGYVHDTHMSQYIPPTAMHCVTGTWTDRPPAHVAGTIAMHKAAGAETAVVNIPIMLPSNSQRRQGLTAQEHRDRLRAFSRRRHQRDRRAQQGHARARRRRRRRLQRPPSPRTLPPALPPPPRTSTS